MERVKGVEDLNICIIGTQGIVGADSFIPTCIVSCRVVGSRRTKRGGSHAGPAIFFLSASCHACSGGCFWESWLRRTRRSV